MNNKELLLAAKKSQQNSYSPYSNFRVGAALLSDSGVVYTGCNIESSSFSLTICAERTAIFKAISEGERSFRKILIVSDSEDYIPPCGACRQVLFDLAGDIEVIMTNSSGEEKSLRLTELLPNAFGNSFLKRK